MTKYEEVMNALAFYFGIDETDEVKRNASIYEIVEQHDDCIEVISDAIEAYEEKDL